jgi:hypothetical protein
MMIIWLFLVRKEGARRIYEDIQLYRLERRRI